MRPRGWLEFSMWGAGLALILFYTTSRVWSEHARVQGIDTFRQEHSLPGDQQAARPALDPAVDQSLWSRARTLAYAKSSSAPGSPEAILRIPSLELEVPVYTGASELNLNRGAARIDGTSGVLQGGNIGIAGHRDGFFRKLKDIGIGTDIYLDVGGRAMRFVVVDLSIVTPSDARVLAPTPVPSITLVTCYPFYFVGPAPQRFVVRAEVSAAESVRRSVIVSADPTTTR